MIAKRYTTEEQAKAALAERRRIAREEAEKLAELERQRKEAEELAEQQRIAEEEENQRRLEEETLRLAEEQKKIEELRLLQAIEVKFVFLISIAVNFRSEVLMLKNVVKLGIPVICWELF